jgi:hypothetical protein
LPFRRADPRFAVLAHPLRWGGQATEIDA